MESTQLTFLLPDSDSEMRFLREYMVPAWDRFQEHDGFESGWFWPAGDFATHDTPELTREQHDLERLEVGQVILIVNGVLVPFSMRNGSTGNGIENRDC